MKILTEMEVKGAFQDDGLEPKLGRVLNARIRSSGFILKIMGSHWRDFNREVVMIRF